VPSAPAAPEAAAQAPARDKAIAAEDSVDKDEEVLQTPPPAAVKPRSAPELPKAEHKPEHKPEPKPEPKPEHKPEPKPEHKADSKAEHKLADKAEKAEKPARPKSEDKPAKPHEDARAMAILEGKPAEKERPAESGAQKFVLQVAALSSAEKAAEVQAKLREAGISSYTQKTTTAAGQLIRVRVGPFSREDAEKMRARLGHLNMSGTISPI
jgi:DedD protein